MVAIETGHIAEHINKHVKSQTVKSTTTCLENTLQGIIRTLHSEIPCVQQDMIKCPSSELRLVQWKNDL